MNLGEHDDGQGRAEAGRHLLAGPDGGGDGEPGTEESDDLFVRDLDVSVLRAVGRATNVDDDDIPIGYIGYIDVVASTGQVDSYDEVVEQSWDLSRWEKNAPFLWAHLSRTLPIGKGDPKRTKLNKDGNLETRLYFLDADGNPDAPRVFRQYEVGALRAVSVGFIPGAVDVVRDPDGVERFHLRDNLLCETSAVPIPANAGALAKSRERQTARLKALAIRHAEAKGAHAPNGKTTPPGPGPDAERERVTMENLKELAAAHERALDDLKSMYDKREAEQRSAHEKALADERAKTATAEKATAEEHARLVEASAKAARLEADLGVERAAKEAAEARARGADDAKAALVKRATSAETKLVAHDIDSIVGRKVYPSERDSVLAFHDMASKSADYAVDGKCPWLAYYAKLLARKDIEVAGPPRIPAEKDITETPGAGAPGQRLEERDKGRDEHGRTRSGDGLLELVDEAAHEADD
jgi:Caudovirus prohead serine protease